VFVLFSASAVQCAPGHWTRGLYSWIMDWSGYLFNVINVIKVFRLTYVHRVV